MAESRITRPLPDLLYTVPETAQILKINKPKVYALVKAGLLPALKLDSIKIRRADLAQFLKQSVGYDFRDLSNVVKCDFTEEEVRG